MFILRLLISNNFSFCFSNSGWAVGPSGGIVEPDLVERMRLLSFLVVGGYCFLALQLILTYFVDVLSFGVV